MQGDVLKELERMAKDRGENITTIIARAVEIGIEKIRVEMILDQYFKKIITREEAIKLVGMDAVKLAERQRKAVIEDIEWGLYE